MWKKYVWTATATLIPLVFLGILLVFAGRGALPAPGQSGGAASPQPGFAPPGPAPVEAMPPAPGPAPVQTQAPAPEPASFAAQAPASVPAPAQTIPAHGELTLVPGSTRRVCQLTGDADLATGAPTLNETGRRLGIVAADLSATFEHKGRTCFLFGPVWENLEHSGGSPALAWTGGNDPATIHLEFNMRPDGKWLPPSLAGFNQGTVLQPTGAIALDDVLYAVFNMGPVCVLASSTDDGRTFGMIFMWPGGKFKSVSFCAAGDWMYLYGRGESRRSGMFLARARIAEIQNGQPRLEFFGGMDENGMFTQSSRDTDAVPLFPGEAVGNYSVSRVDAIQKFVLLYDSDQPPGVTLRHSDTPWGPWSEGILIFDPRRDGANCPFAPPAGAADAPAENVNVYGPCLISRFTQPTESGIRLYYALSAANPPQVHVLQSDLTTPPPQSAGAAAGPVGELDIFGNPLDEFTKKVFENRGIAGEVVMAGKPVAGATVIMRRLPPESINRAHERIAAASDLFGKNAWVGETDSEGKFIFTDLDVGHYGLEAFTGSACGYDDMPVRPNSLPGNPEGGIAYNTGRAHMSIELRPSAQLAGRVVTPDGKPVPEACVFPVQVEQDNAQTAVEPIPLALLGTKTGADGSFLFPRLPAGRWQLEIRGAGSMTALMTDWLPTGAQPVEIRMESLPGGAQAMGQIPRNVEFNPANYRGKHVLLDFWAAWCGPCKAEMPNVKAVFEEYRDDPRLIVVGLNLDARVEDGERYVAENGLNWTHVYLGDWNKTPVPKQFGVTGIPALFLLDTEGRIVAREMRGAGIREAVFKALGPPSRQGQAESPGTETAPAATVLTAGQPQKPGFIETTRQPRADQPGATELTLILDIYRDFEYVPEGWPLGLGVFQTDTPPLTPGPQESQLKEPRYKSSKPLYGYLPLGNAADNKFTFVIEDTDAKDWSGYFDRNNNGDLTDDGPAVVISSNVDFEVEVVLPSGNTVKSPYRIWQWGHRDGGVPGLRFYAVCHYRARTAINGKPVTAVAFDMQDHDALYKNDGIWLDLNQNNSLEENERFNSGDTVTVNGEPVRIRVVSER